MPEGCTALKVGRTIKVYRKKKGKRAWDDYRCKDCVHYGMGHTGLSRWTTTVCDIRPKRLRESMMRKKASHPIYSGYALYYHAKPYDFICDKFELKNE